MRSLSKVALATAVLATMAPVSVKGQVEWTSSRPDGHAPIGVMGDHTHEAGEFMFSYRYMSMSMDGNLDGSDEVSPEEITRPDGPYGFMVAPLEMPMQMHMLGIMYAPSDRITLMGMANYTTSSMNHRMRSGMEFETESGSLGDVGLSALIGLIQEGPRRLHLTAGVTLPTGSINQQDVTPMSDPAEAVLPYPMQTGIGSPGLNVGATFLGMAERVSWGAQGRWSTSMGGNERQYTVGDRLLGTAWLAWRAVDRLSFSVRGAYSEWHDYDGADPDLNPMMAPTMRTDLRGGKRIDIPVGANYWINSGALSGLRFLVEYDIPVWHDLSGPQLKSTGALTVGAQLSR